MYFELKAVVMNASKLNLWPTWAGAALDFVTNLAVLCSFAVARLISLLDKSSLNNETSAGPTLLCSLCLMSPTEGVSTNLFGCFKPLLLLNQQLHVLVIDAGLLCPQLQK